MSDYKRSDSTNIAEYIESQQLAVEIAQLGGRVSLIVQLTGLSERLARTIVEELTGVTQRKGKRPYSLDSFLITTSSFLQATVLVKLYKSYQKMGLTHARSFLESYREFNRIYQGNVTINIDEWGVVSKHLENKATLTLVACNVCHMEVLKKPGRIDPCPSCTQLSFKTDKMPVRRRNANRF